MGFARSNIASASAASSAKSRWQETFMRSSPLCRLSGAPRLPAAYRQKLIAKKKKRQLEEAKRVMELDRNLILIAVLIVALPIIGGGAAMFAVLAAGGH